MKSIRLKPGREKSLARRHPWIFSGALEPSTFKEDAPGETVEILSSEGRRLAQAAWNSHSQIAARVWTWDESEMVDAALLRKRMQSAIAARSGQTDEQKNKAGERLIYAESDGLPGFILDRYADTLVAQFLSAGAEYWRETLLDLAQELTGLERIYERSDQDVRRLEGLVERKGLLRGQPLAESVLLEENGLKFAVDISGGHKTGFYLDQRANRQRVRAYAAGRECLDCFCYSGGFTLNLVAGGARSVMAVDSSEAALLQGQANLALNGLGGTGFAPVDWRAEDVFVFLRRCRDERRQFDLIILDPPKFAPTAAQVERAARGYKDINLLAFKLLRPGGVLFTFSCSGGVDALLFQKIIAGAALDAGVEAQILEYLSQPADHPVALNYPEAAYLKGLVVLKK